MRDTPRFSVEAAFYTNLVVTPNLFDVSFQGYPLDRPDLVVRLACLADMR